MSASMPNKAAAYAKDLGHRSYCLKSKYASLSLCANYRSRTLAGPGLGGFSHEPPAAANQWPDRG